MITFKHELITKYIFSEFHNRQDNKTNEDKNLCFLVTKIVSWYDQDIPQSQTADKPMASSGRAENFRILPSSNSLSGKKLSSWVFEMVKLNMSTHIKNAMYS